MLNSVSLIGNLGSDPRIEFDGTTKTARFTLSNTVFWKDGKNQSHERTTRLHVLAVGEAADGLSAVVQGDQIALAGRLQAVTDAKGTQVGIEVLADRIDFLRLARWRLERKPVAPPPQPSAPVPAHAGAHA